MKTLNSALYAVGGATVVAALVLIGLGHLLLGAAVCFIGLIPASFLTVAIGRKQGPPTRQQGLANQRTYARVLLIIGVVALVAGGILSATASGPLSTVLLWGGPGMLLGGITVYLYVREEQKSTPK